MLRPRGQPSHPYATVERVSDGDTLVAITANQTKLRIRLLGIDAPETAHGKKAGQPFGLEARNYLDHLIGGKTVKVEMYGPDRYKRILAVIWDEQINVNLLMVVIRDVASFVSWCLSAPCHVASASPKCSRYLLPREGPGDRGGWRMSPTVALSRTSRSPRRATQRHS